MVTAILRESDAQLKVPEIDGLARPPEAEPTSLEGSIVIRMNLSGIVGTRILAEDSATEERLRECLRAAHPALERLCKGLNAHLPQGPCTR